MTNVCALCQHPYPDDGNAFVLFCRTCLSNNVVRERRKATKLASILTRVLEWVDPATPECDSFVLLEAHTILRAMKGECHDE